MSEYTPVTITVTVTADKVMDFPDIRLRLLIRQLVIGSTLTDLTLDEAVSVLESELDYLQGRIREAK